MTARHTMHLGRQWRIPRNAIEVILDIGREEQSFDSHFVVFMDRAARRSAKKAQVRIA